MPERAWETLAENSLFSVTMDADSSMITVYLTKAGAPGYYAWLKFPYADWRQLCRMVLPFDLSSRGEKRTSGLGSIERTSADDVALTVGVLTVCIPLDHFRQMQETVQLADQRILKANP